MIRKLRIKLIIASMVSLFTVFTDCHGDNQSAELSWRDRGC